MATGSPAVAADSSTLAEAAEQELGCSERSVPAHILDSLSRLALHLFDFAGEDAPANESTAGKAISTQEGLHLQALHEDLDGLERFARGFAFRPGAGLPGWQRTFGPLQGCPLVFVAAELAMAVHMWVPGVGIDVNWASNFDVFATERTRAQRSHFARALVLADSFRMWYGRATRHVTTLETVLRRGRFIAICELLTRGRWHIINQFADIALRGIGCGPLNAYVFISDLLGCSRRAPTLDALCAAPTLGPRSPSSTLAGFWEELSEALLLRPTIQLPWGFQAGASQVIAQVMQSLTVPAADAGEPLFFEFGVYNASSVNFIARALQKKAAMGPARRASPVVYGFDSFQGLPTHWRRVFGHKEAFTAGSFRLSELPKVHPKVHLVPGWFNETLPGFLDDLMSKGSPWARFVHIDCDLYESTRQVLQSLAPLLRSGTVLVFDELVNYPEFAEGELLALFELLQEHHWSIRVLHGPWSVVRRVEDFAVLEAEGVTEGDLSQSVALELLA